MWMILHTLSITNYQMNLKFILTDLDVLDVLAKLEFRWLLFLKVRFEK